MQETVIMTSIEDVKKTAESGDFKVIPIKAEMYSDMKTPIQLMASLKDESHHCFILESVDNTKRWGRYTFLGYNPILEISCANGCLSIKDNKAHTEIYEKVNPKKYIENILHEYKSPKLEGYPSFTGGLVGYFSYDYIKYSEPSLNLDANDTENFKDVDLMLFDKIIAFDNQRQKIVIIVNIKTDNIEENYKKGCEEIKNISNIILKNVPKKSKPLKLKSEIRSLFTKEEYCGMVNKAKKYIYEGDIFQVVLSNRLDADAEGSIFDVYRVLRTENPSPYMFYFASDDVEIAGSSPETLVRLEDGVLHTYPLAGTRPRGIDDTEDKRLEEELLADEKERAEHNMLVDLGRNDIGKISKFGSVQVESYMEIQRFSKVMHIGSSVRGEISENKTVIDAIDSILPAGTLSGAPKIRACEIINELENNKRGIYGGAIGYLDFTGNLDVCIAIRLAFKKQGKLFIRSGAGIVADSIPENEYQECINKAKAVVNAVKLAEGGIEA
ncbi:MAG: anthranilate synthase component I [Oscillospiraceae bacterium]|nr:anthranilate synthase component I [Oscillospiraceae bacterium]